MNVTVEGGGVDMKRFTEKDFWKAVETLKKAHEGALKSKKASNHPKPRKRAK